MKRTRYRITRTSDRRWEVKREGAQRCDSVHPTQAGTIQRGRDLGRARQPAQLVVHGQNGKIRFEHTYGNDPARWKG